LGTIFRFAHFTDDSQIDAVMQLHFDAADMLEKSLSELCGHD